MKILSTNEIMLSDTEIKTICKLGQGKECCAYLVCGTNGFSCIKKLPSLEKIITKRLEANTMNAQGRGGWEGCPWHIPNLNYMILDKG